jgi:hypothetical protein
MQGQQLQLAEEEVAVEADELVGRCGLRERHRGRARRRRKLHGRRGRGRARGDGDTTALVLTTHNCLQIGRESDKSDRRARPATWQAWRDGTTASTQALPKDGRSNLEKTQNFKRNHVNPFCKGLK